SGSYAPAKLASTAASRAAASAKRITRSSRRRSLKSTSPASTSPFTWPAMRTGSGANSSPSSVPTPDSPRSSACQVDSASFPSGVTQPRPVTTTRRRAPPATLGLDFFLQVVDGVPDGLDPLGIVVRDLDVELLLHRHHELDDVERVGAEVVD